MSLLEVLISLVILLVVSLALMRTSIVGLQTNLQNSLREEAARIADKAVGNLRARTFSQAFTDPVLNAGTTTDAVTRKFRSGQTIYSVKTTIGDISAGSKQVSVEVKWNYRGSDYSHTTTAIVGRQ
jgi:type IV pilus assembly protein PilV